MNFYDMCAQNNNAKPSLILSIFKNKCPRCRRGDVYERQGAFRLKGLMIMNKKCPVCGQPLDMEPGFYYGTNLISYALSIMVSVISFVLWISLVGISLKDARFFWWIGMNAILLFVLQPPLMRISRTIWLAFFVKYSPRWKEGDIVQQFSISKEHQHNW